MSICVVCNKNNKGQPFFTLKHSSSGRGFKVDKTANEKEINKLKEIPAIKALCAATTPAEAEAALKQVQNAAEKTDNISSYTIKGNDKEEIFTLLFYKSCKKAPLPVFPIGLSSGTPSSIKDMLQFVNPPQRKCAIM